MTSTPGPEATGGNSPSEADNEPITHGTDPYPTHYQHGCSPSLDDPGFNQEFLPPSIELLRTKDYTNINRIAECNHLTDDNWHEWKERMSCVFLSCDITRYVFSTIKWPDP
jgi:hypothetical protein